MVIIGAKGFAKEILEILYKNGDTEDLCFYDDITDDIPSLLYGRFPVLRSEGEIIRNFKDVNPSFALGIGNPKLRYKLCEKFQALGGNLISTISNRADIGNFEVKLGMGCNILDGAKISNDVKIGIGVIIYYNSIITHDVEIGDFAEISPGAILLGRCKVGAFTQIGAGAIVFPNVKVGNNVIIGAGAVVRNNIPSNSVAVGTPARVIKQN